MYSQRFPQSPCQKACSGSCAGSPKKEAPVLWVILSDHDRLSLYERHHNRSLHFLGIPNLTLKSIDGYLEEAFRQGKFTYLVLVGSREHMDTLRDHLCDDLQKRVIADIERCFNGESSDALREKLECLMTF